MSTETAARPSGWHSTTGSRAPSTAAVLRGTILVVGALAVLAPVVWASLSSFKTQRELAQRPPSPLPESFAPDNYTQALSEFSFGQYFMNSVVVTVAATPSS